MRECRILMAHDCTRTLCAVCEECSVFAIDYKYIVEGLRKTIRRAKIIEHSF